MHSCAYSPQISAQLHRHWLSSIANGLQSAETAKAIQCDKHGMKILVEDSETTTPAEEADFAYVPIILTPCTTIEDRNQPLPYVTYAEETKNEVMVNSQSTVHSNRTWVLLNFNLFPVCFTVTTLAPSEQFILIDSNNEIVEQTLIPTQTFEIAANSVYRIKQNCMRVSSVGMVIQYLLFQFHFPLTPDHFPYTYTSKTVLIARRTLAINVNQKQRKILNKESVPYYSMQLRASLDVLPEIEFISTFPSFPAIQCKKSLFLFDLPSNLLRLNQARFLLHHFQEFDSAWKLYYEAQLKRCQSIHRNELALHCEKMKLALIAEELQMLADIREYDMFDIQLKPCKNHTQQDFAVLTVPGVAEGKPTVAIGDLVTIWLGALKISCLCYVTNVFNDQITMTFPASRLVQYLQLRALHVLFDKFLFNVRFSINRQAIQHMYTALNEFQLAPQRFEHFIFPKLPTQVTPTLPIEPLNALDVKLFNKFVNEEQLLAIRQIVIRASGDIPASGIRASDCIYIIQGPPGTGKTMTVVESVLQTLEFNNKRSVLVCTPSNFSADIIVDRLSKFGMKRSQLVRLNSYQRHTTLIPGIERYCYLDVSTGLYCIPPLQVLLKYRVIVCTCAVSGILYQLGMKIGHFHSIFFDESSQAIEPEMYIPLMLADQTTKIVIAGDHMQLSPVIHSKVAHELGLHISLQERLIQLELYSKGDASVITCLLKNYRAHPVLLRITSELFYNSSLQSCAEAIEVNSLTSWCDLPNRNNFPLLFYGCVGQDVFEQEQSSFYNPTEISIIVQLIQSLTKQKGLKVDSSDIAVIAPFRLQVMKLRQLLRESGLAAVQVNDVEAFQGIEQRIVLISTTLSRKNSKKFLNVLCDQKRVNVTLSRAKCLTVIVGNPHILQTDRNWNSVIDYCLRNSSYTGCSAPIELQYLSKSASVLGAGYSFCNDLKNYENDEDDDASLPKLETGCQVSRVML